MILPIFHATAKVHPLWNGDDKLSASDAVAINFIVSVFVFSRRHQLNGRLKIVQWHSHATQLCTSLVEVNESLLDVFDGIRSVHDLLSIIAEEYNVHGREEEGVLGSRGFEYPELLMRMGTPAIVCEVGFLREIEHVVLDCSLKVQVLEAFMVAKQHVDVVLSSGSPKVNPHWLLAAWTVCFRCDVAVGRSIGEVFFGILSEKPEIFDRRYDQRV